MAPSEGECFGRNNNRKMSNLQQVSNRVAIGESINKYSLARQMDWKKRNKNGNQLSQRAWFEFILYGQLMNSTLR